jgi:large subunit ribosomal protein L21
MNAVIQTGGKQYTVKAGDVITVEKLDGEIGSTVSLDVILCYGEGKVADKPVSVTAAIFEHGKGEKINGFKYKPKNNVRKRWGHRQQYTKIKIESVK